MTETECFDKQLILTILIKIPFSLIEPGKETKIVIDEVSKKICDQVEYINNNDSETDIFGHRIKFKSDIKMTQIDHKVRMGQIGGGGMFCTCCDSTKGFKI